jgi:hypothetical protein
MGAHEEALYMKPEGPGPFPTIFFILGDQIMGAFSLIQYGLRLQQKGWALFAMTLPGSLTSGLDSDLCGPKDLMAFKRAFDVCNALPTTDRARTACWGTGLGATTAALHFFGNPDTCPQVLILQSGCYDLASAHKSPFTHPETKKLLFKHTAGDPILLTARSPLLRPPAKLSFPTLCIALESDTQFHYNQTEQFYKHMMPENPKTELSIVPEDEPRPQNKARWKIGFTFITRVLNMQ